MGLLSRLLRLFGFGGSGPPEARATTAPSRPKRRWKRARLRSLHSAPQKAVARPAVYAETKPYRFARPWKRLRVGWKGIRTEKGYVDDSQDIDRGKLARRGLPILATPDDLAIWLDLPLGKVAWLAGRFQGGTRPPSVRAAHYVFTWKAKRKGGVRLLASPKPMLAEVQRRILRDILDKVPAHPAAHGFVRARSILTNATPHVGRAVVLKLDLENFYASVRFSRVVAIYRSLGYSREAALWLAALTTTAIPSDLPLPSAGAHALRPYLGRHLPQGAPTSPALANLSAYSLDVRLAGLARAFGATYTRYADDLTFSGDGDFGKTLRNLIPLAEQVIRKERFRVQKAKRKVLRRGQRQTVAGVVVNEKPNVRRDEYDRLKALLNNAIRHGAASQNRENHPDFAAHLRGRIAHVAMLNPARGAKLARLYDRIDFR